MFNINAKITIPNFGYKNKLGNTAGEVHEHLPKCNSKETHSMVIEVRNF